jgi:hypothetical protein
VAAVLAEAKGSIVTTFRICLTGSPQPLLIDLPVSSVEELSHAAGSSRFLAGHMAEPNEDGVCPGVMIQTNRIQWAFEAG